MDLKTNESLKKKLCLLAREGNLISFTLLINKLSVNLEYFLNDLCEFDNIKCNPLIIAALNGQIKIIEFLLNLNNINVELEGNIFYDDYLVENATALWCAASHGHFEIVKLLVELGKANVNHANSTNSTPLRAACYIGSFKIAKFLIINGADYNLPNIYNNNCLMITCLKNHLILVEYLISLFVDLNQQTKCGYTALHFAAEHGNLEVIKILLKNGAKVLKNVLGLTPLMLAADKNQEEIVNFFINQKIVDIEEVIIAYELLGASFINSKRDYSEDKGFNYFKKAKSLYSNEYLKIFNEYYSTYKPIKAYGYRTECKNLENLELIENNHYALFMESLLIRERILGKTPELVHLIKFRGAFFADEENYDHCFNLWVYSLKLNQFTNYFSSSLDEDLLHFIQLFSLIFNLNSFIPFNYLLQILDFCLLEKDNIKNCVLNVFYLIFLCSKTLSYLNSNEEEKLYEIIYKLNKLNLKTQETGSSLLHLAIDSNTPINSILDKNFFKLPSSSTVSLLINCGADVNLKDNKGNSPLHLIAKYEKAISDFLTIHTIVKKLIEAGAHPDYINSNNQTPLDLVVVNVASIIIKSQIKLKLSCLAAKAINKYKINYMNKVPNFLYEFISKHSS